MSKKKYKDIMVFKLGYDKITIETIGFAYTPAIPTQQKRPNRNLNCSELIVSYPRLIDNRKNINPKYARFTRQTNVLK